ncbi:MAG: WecB/TagA/CpsF family glycosyltransferase [Patescibacteria group bacterium]|nr:WecB/TagA/CpsF family glycosyltransferase [Patescibacteria group bacterium]MDD5294395.1 WecB/TagA/CpsF family glycosyltransferase [Patescibacteria group bacterium]MDD5554830.1 WecB/TagA/CpsF family glycosyltransferase [Patescibacteria group bacterium]
MINILGINISTLKRGEVLKKIEQFLKDGKQHYIVTPNPEIVLGAHRDEEFFYILNKADLAIPDGAGLKFAAWAMGKNLRRVTGADLVSDVGYRMSDLAYRQAGLRLAVVNWRDGLSKKEDIERALAGFKIKEFFVKDVSRGIKQDLSDLTEFKPDILFCTLGAPFQEKFIYHNLKNLPSVKVAIGVGGAFDFLTGKIKRAPKILRWLCLEWLWRLIKQPQRVKRIYQAVIVFPYKFFKWKFIRPWQYRPNVVCLLYKKDKGQYKVLLAERREAPGHWQLLQGGTDNEDLMTAGARELREEIATDKFKGVVVFPNLWKYKFGNSMCRGVLSKYIGGYKGQKQGLFIAEFMGEDKDITINFWDHRNWKWVKADNLVNEVYPIRREATKIFLEKFKNHIAHKA